MPEEVSNDVVAAPVISAPRRMYWSVRRELWESRSIYLAPLFVAGVFLLGFLISASQLPDKISRAQTLPAAQRRELIGRPYDFAEAAIMATTFVVAIFYCLD